MSTPVKNQRRRHADSGFLQINYNKEAEYPREYPPRPRPRSESRAHKYSPS